MNADRLDQLLARMRAGEDGAYALFLAKAADRLRAEFARQVPSDEGLEKLVRQCLIAVHRKRHTLPSKLPVAPWLNAIGRYQLAEHGPLLARKPARPLAAERQSGMARLLEPGDAADASAGARSSAILDALIRRVRRATARNPSPTDGAGA